MDIYQFKVKDFSTVLVGQMYVNENNEKIFYVERADGTKYKYEEYRISWSKMAVTMS